MMSLPRPVGGEEANNCEELHCHTSCTPGNESGGVHPVADIWLSFHSNRIPMQRFAVNARWYPMYWLLLICACGGGKAAWPSMSVNVDYGGCEDKAAAACMCVGGVCHSTGDTASRSLMIHLGLLVYRFTTRYNLSMYSRPLPWDGDSCEGSLFGTFVTHDCTLPPSSTHIVSYDLDACALYLRVHRANECDLHAKLVEPVVPLQWVADGGLRQYYFLRVFLNDFVTGRTEIPAHQLLITASSESLLKSHSDSQLDHANENGCSSSGSLLFVMQVSSSVEGVQRVDQAVRSLRAHAACALAVVFCETADTATKVEAAVPQALVFVDAGQSLWWAVKYMLPARLALNFSFVIVATGAVVVGEPAGLFELVEGAQEFKLAGFQPCINHDPGCYTGFLRCRWGMKLQVTDFLDAVMMGFSRDTFTCMRSRVLQPDGNFEGLGVDISLVGMCPGKYGVLDAMQIGVACDYGRHGEFDQAALAAGGRLQKMRLLPVPPSTRSVSSIVHNGWLPAPLSAEQNAAVRMKRVKASWNPGIFGGLARKVLRQWQQNGGIQRENVDAAATLLEGHDPCSTPRQQRLQRAGFRCVYITGGFRATLVNGSLWLKNLGRSYQSRRQSSQHLLLLAMQGASLPDFDVVINTGDFPLAVKSNNLANAKPMLSYAVTKDVADVAWPCFSFWDWPETDNAGWAFSRELQLLSASAFPWGLRQRRVFWRGSDNGKVADDQGVVTRRRRPLIDAAKKHPTIFDAVFTSSKRSGTHTPLADHCRYRYLANVGGDTYSARLKWLLACGSTLLHADGTDAGSEFFEPLLHPWKHFIPVDATLSNITKAANWAQEHETEAEQIAKNGQSFILNHLRMEDVLGYMRLILEAASNATVFNVQKPDGATQVRTHADIDDLR